MQTSVPTRKRPAKARTLTADSRLPYPPNNFKHASKTPECWLVFWMREQAQAEEIKKLRNLGSAPRSDAMYAAFRELQATANHSMAYLVSTGGLLFAWAGTTHPAVRS